MTKTMFRAERQGGAIIATVLVLLLIPILAGNCSSPEPGRTIPITTTEGGPR